MLIAVEDLESLIETLEVPSDPEAMAAIEESRSGRTELTTGQVIYHDEGEVPVEVVKISHRADAYG